MPYHVTLYHKIWYQSALCHLNYPRESTHVRLQFTPLPEHDNRNSDCPPDSRIWQEIKVTSRCSGWCQPSGCVHINRCGARMTDNLSTKSFYPTHVRAVTIFLLSEAVLMTSLSRPNSTVIINSVCELNLCIMYIWVYVIWLLRK